MQMHGFILHPNPENNLDVYELYSSRIPAATYITVIVGATLLLY